MSLFFKSPLEKLKAASQKLLNKADTPGIIRDILSKPLPDDNESLFNCNIISIDFETTGLDFKNDFVLSMGYVLIKNGTIDFTTCRHRYLNVHNKIKSGSAVINQITPEQLMNGAEESQAFDELLQQIPGSIVLCHASVIEKNFILKYLNMPDNYPLPIIFLDTMKIERSLKSYSGNVAQLSLSAIRKRRDLPSYVAHNALADSVATAELFLCQVRDVFGRQTPTLGPLYRRSL